MCLNHRSDLNFKKKEELIVINIKILADKYRKQVMETATDQKAEFQNVAERADIYYIGRLSGQLGKSFSNMKKALGTERELSDLKRAWIILKRISGRYKLMKKFIIPEEDRDFFLKEIRLAESLFDRYFKKLPFLIERSLTRNVRRSGIRIR